MSHRHLVCNLVYGLLVTKSGQVWPYSYSSVVLVKTSYLFDFLSAVIQTFVNASSVLICIM